MSFEPRQIINGSLITQFIGKSVSIFVQVNGDSSSTQIIKAKTTDNHDVTVFITEPVQVRALDWIEVLGSPVANDKIKAREVIVFEKGDQEFDVEGHNMLVVLLNNVKDLYRQG